MCCAVTPTRKDIRMPPSKQEKRARPRREIRVEENCARIERSNRKQRLELQNKVPQSAPVIRCSAARISIGSFLQSTMRSNRVEKQRRRGIAAQLRAPEQAPTKASTRSDEAPCQNRKTRPKRDRRLLREECYDGPDKNLWSLTQLVYQPFTALHRPLCRP